MIVRERPVREVRVTSRRPESREAFAARMTERIGMTVTPYATAREVVEGADMVITCTSANTHLVPAEWLAEGSTICLLGQDELYPAAYRAVDKVIVSDVEVVKEATDVREVLRRGELTLEEIWSDLAGVVAGTKPGRQSARERIAIRASGLVSQDVAFSHFVYREAVRRGMGIRLPVG
jgi:ornithine cyclodeaminase/alanine dehydrogenase-like protein (mu-crystallin family)